MYLWGGIGKEGFKVFVIILLGCLFNEGVNKIKEFLNCFCCCFVRGIWIWYLVFFVFGM